MSDKRSFSRWELLKRDLIVWFIAVVVGLVAGFALASNSRTAPEPTGVHTAREAVTGYGQET